MDKEALRELAEKATPGPWIAGDDGDSDYFLVGPAAFDTIVCNAVTKLHSEANADFIAAANPQTILALLAEIQSLTEERTAWRTTAENAEAELKAIKEAEPVAWEVYVAEVDNSYLVDSLDDPQLIDDCTNHDAVVTPLYTLQGESK